ncbi:hypothetical protein LLG10_06435 [bacterium]|nr:hypothetical protein [bacterium]
MGKGAYRELLGIPWKVILKVVIVLFILALPVLIWYVSPSKVMNVWLLDKTVPNKTYREHKGLVWALNYFKIHNQKKNEIFLYNRDYYGFFPKTKEEYDIVEFYKAAPENPDLIYITDTYGVYRQEYMLEQDEQRLMTGDRDLNDIFTGERSEKFFGGISQEDIFKLKTSLHNNTTLIAEWNTFNSPTTEDNRRQMEQILGVKWRKWMGRYFFDLDRNKEVALWMIRNYEEQSGKKWEFKGPGYVIASDWDQIIVLEQHKDFGSKELRMAYEPSYQKEFGNAMTVPYYYWFDFIDVEPDTEVCAKFYFDLTDEGKKKMEKVGLPSVFPAVVRKKAKDHTTYYLAGDMSDQESVPSFYAIAGSHWLRRWLSLNFKGESGYFYWRVYVPLMQKIINDVSLRDKNPVSTNPIVSVYQENSIEMTSRIEGKQLKVYTDNQWKPIFLKAINMGMAEPGKWFTEFPKDLSTYTRWLTLIGQMNCNAIRVYTLMDPSFYEALYLYNEANPTKPIWLMQGIWPEEHPPNDDYLDEAYNKGFQKEIEYGVDAIHGNVVIEERKGRAWGIYQADVSPYVIAFLVGRELEAKEVQANDLLNKGYSFQGQYFQTLKGASPTEGWLAGSCDAVVKYERENYGWSRPISIVSWPTMDILNHDSEWEALTDKSNQFDDLTSININHIKTTDELKCGFFGSYHIYPNYPDFMNNDSKYKAYRDAQGRFMYGGYLKDFMAVHSQYPAFVGEFGLANGMGNAHSNPDGLHHGSLTEEQQGNGIVRMMKAIKQEKYMGGAIFEWMDEWAKKTWTTEPFMIPYERHVLWHNIVCPEQNYGILANEAIEKVTSEYTLSDGKGLIEKMEMRTNEEYFFIDLYTNKLLDLKRTNLHIGLDTYSREWGERFFTPDKTVQAPSGMEFKIEIVNGTARLLVIPSYNYSQLKFASSSVADGVFQSIHPIINKERTTKDGVFIPAVYENASQMLIGDFEGSRNSWFQQGKKIRIRIPWQRILVTDPSSHYVLNDTRKMNTYPERDSFQTLKTEGFVVFAIVTNREDQLLDIFPGDKTFDKVEPFLWKGWEQPRYRERLKKSYEILQRFLKDFAE